MSLLMAGYNGGAGSGSGGAGAGPGHGDLLYQDVVLAPIATVHDQYPLGQATEGPDHHMDWHQHHLQDLHSPYSMESDSAIGLSPSPDFSLGGLSSSSNNCASSGGGSSSTKEDAVAAASTALAVCGAAAAAAAAAAAVAAEKKSRGPRQQQSRTAPRHNIDVNDNSLYAVYEFFKSFMSTSTASTVAIDNKIEQAMDLVKSHLMFAVREEVEVLKEKITELMERINQLEYENTVLKQYATSEALQQIQQHHNSNT